MKIIKAVIYAVAAMIGGVIASIISLAIVCIAIGLVGTNMGCSAENLRPVGELIGYYGAMLTVLVVMPGCGVVGALKGMEKREIQ